MKCLAQCLAPEVSVLSQGDNDIGIWGKAGSGCSISFCTKFLPKTCKSVSRHGRTRGVCSGSSFSQGEGAGLTTPSPVSAPAP